MLGTSDMTTTREQALCERLDRLRVAARTLLDSSRNDLLLLPRPCVLCGNLTQFNLCWGCEGRRRRERN